MNTINAIRTLENFTVLKGCGYYKYSKCSEKKESKMFSEKKLYLSHILNYLEKQTMNTNPDTFNGHENFIKYMKDDKISNFGRWQFANGFNAALVAIEIEVKRIMG